MEHFEESGDYSDLSLFYPIRNSKIKFYQNGYVSKKTFYSLKRNVQNYLESMGMETYYTKIIQTCTFGITNLI